MILVLVSRINQEVVFTKFYFEVSVYHTERFRTSYARAVPNITLTNRRKRNNSWHHSSNEGLCCVCLQRVQSCVAGSQNRNNAILS